MLKHIAVDALEVGMFVHRFEGSWFDHPFWKSRFLIEDEDRLAAIRASRLQGVVIDTARGKDIAAPPVPECRRDIPPPAAPGAGRIGRIRRRAGAQLAPPRAVSMAEELNAATAIAERGRERLAATFLAARLGKALDVRKVEPVVSDILVSVRRNPQAFSGLMRCKLRNEAVFRHALSVSALMVALADRMKLPPATIHECGLAGLLLDIGVNYLPQGGDPAAADHRALDPRIWQQHVMLGHRALANDGDLPQPVLEAVLMHHERIDGRGYPQRLAGDRIPAVARMAAICDSFEFQLAGSGARPGRDPAAAVAAMRADAGAFDAEILRAFIETVGLYPVGSFVELASRKLAMVIDEDRSDPARPVVQAFYSLQTGERILPHRIVLGECNDNEQIVGIADLTGLDLPDDPQLRELVFLSAHRGAARA
jgi:HD-GYP domain-containing protein (c-di-GMP phosphodiesterase class II)